MEWGRHSGSFFWLSSCPRIICSRDYFFPIEWSWHLCQKSIGHKGLVFFWIPNSLLILLLDGSFFLLLTFFSPFPPFVYKGNKSQVTCKYFLQFVFWLYFWCFLYVEVFHLLVVTFVSVVLCSFWPLLIPNYMFHLGLRYSFYSLIYRI